jgi:muramidase (phage lysozyme)
MTLTDLQIALANSANLAAFLRAIRLGEGTSDDAGYNRIVGGQSFTDMSTHPNVKVWVPNYHVYSSAAGAYQITRPTWEGLMGQYNFPDFEAPSQDCMAVALIAEKGAIDLINAGDLAGAVAACAPIWASLPGSQAGQRTEAFDAVQTCYLQNGGKLEATS